MKRFDNNSSFKTLFTTKIVSSSFQFCFLFLYHDSNQQQNFTNNSENCLYFLIKNFLLFPAPSNLDAITIIGLTKPYDNNQVHDVLIKQNTLNPRLVW